MSLIYRLMYLVGFTPWDTGTVPSELTALVEGDGALPPGRALDIGCGTGTQSVYLARHGWQVTGLDVVEKPLRRARARAAAEGVTVHFVHDDVGRLPELGVEPGIGLFLDRGCFHGLSDEQRTIYARSVSALAAPGATLLLMAFARNTVRVGPAGADEDELVRAFPDWSLESSAPDSAGAPAGPLSDVPLRWYRFARRPREHHAPIVLSG